MQTFCKPGDCLVYFKSRTFTADLIRFGEERMDPGEDAYAFHVAIAMGPYEKIEANGKETSKAPIDYGNFLRFRPPYDPVKLPNAIDWLKSQKGRLYGWIGVIDQGIRDLTYGRLHLPRWLITWINNRWPYCSWEGADFVNKAGFKISMYPPPSPEDFYNAVKEWPVT